MISDRRLVLTELYKLQIFMEMAFVKCLIPKLFLSAVNRFTLHITKLSQQFDFFHQILCCGRIRCFRTTKIIRVSLQDFVMNCCGFNALLKCQSFYFYQFRCCGFSIMKKCMSKRYLPKYRPIENNTCT